MNGKDTFKLKVQNLSCFKQSVRLLYTGSGENDIGYYRNDRALKQLNMNSADWGDNFLDASGQAWVKDGKTIPHAFNSAINVVIRFVSGVTLYTTSLTTVAGEAIDAFFVRIAEDMATQLGGDKELDGASPMGIEMYYSSIDELKMIPSQFQVFGGSSYSVQDLAIPTTSFPATMFGASTYPLAFLLTHADGWKIDIIVRDVTNADYKELVNSLLDQNLFIKKVRKHSNSKEQIAEPVVFKKYDMAGFEKQIVDTTVIDPYQAQKVLDYIANIPVDGQTYLSVDVLAGEYMSLTFHYDTSGILNYEQVSEIDKILREQGIDTMNREEEEELEEAFMNFSGFKNDKYKLTQLMVVGLLAYILIKNN